MQLGLVLLGMVSHGVGAASQGSQWPSWATGLTGELWNRRRGEGREREQAERVGDRRGCGCRWDSHFLADLGDGEAVVNRRER